MANDEARIATIVIFCFGCIFLILGVVLQIVGWKRAIKYGGVTSSYSSGVQTSRYSPSSSRNFSESPRTYSGVYSDRADRDFALSSLSSPTEFNFGSVANFGIFENTPSKDFYEWSIYFLGFSNLLFVGAASASLAHVSVNVGTLFNFLASIFGLFLSISIYMGCKESMFFPSAFASLVSCFGVISIISDPDF